MAKVEFTNIGSVARRPWAALAQFSIQLLAWPFFALGGIGAVQVFRLSQQGGEQGIPTEFWVAFGLCVAFLAVGGALKWSASAVRRAIYLPGDWFSTLLTTTQKNDGDGASEAALALVRIDTVSISHAKMALMGHLYLADSTPGDNEHWAHALPLLDRIVEQEPHSVEWLIARSEALYAQAKPLEALADSERVRVLEGTPSRRTLAAHINNLLALQRVADAAAVCEQLRRDPHVSEEVRQAIDLHAAEIRAAESNPHIPPVAGRPVHDGAVPFTLYHKTSGVDDVGDTYKQKCVLKPLSNGHHAQKTKAAIVCHMCQQSIDLKLSEVTFVGFHRHVLLSDRQLRRLVWLNVLLRAPVLAFPPAAMVGLFAFFAGPPILVAVCLVSLAAILGLTIQGLWIVVKSRNGIALPIGRWPTLFLPHLESVAGPDLRRTITLVDMKKVDDVHGIVRDRQSIESSWSVQPWRVDEIDSRSGGVGQLFGAHKMYSPDI